MGIIFWVQLCETGRKDSFLTKVHFSLCWRGLEVEVLDEASLLLGGRRKAGSSGTPLPRWGRSRLWRDIGGLVEAHEDVLNDVLLTSATRTDVACGNKGAMPVILK